MENVLIQTQSKAETELLVALAKKMGMKAKALSKSEVEDWQLAKWIDEAMQGKNVSRDEVMHSLGK
jgi:hypothetical protein